MIKIGWFKKTVIWGIIILLLGYGGYRLYDYAIENAIQRIKTGITEHTRKTVVGALNPFSWFGHHKKNKDKAE